METDVHIIGGGVIGLCAAYYLSGAGYSVTVLEKNTVTDGCSFGNMGYISPSHFIPIASPGIISKGLRWILSSSSPFYIKARMDMDLIRWGLAFRKNSTHVKVEQNMLPLVRLLQLSRSLMSEIKDDLKFDMHEKGCWMLYKNEKTGDHEKHLAEQGEKLGLKSIVCSKDEVQSYEPDVEVDVKGGVLYLDDAHIEPGQFMKSLYRELLARKVKFWLNTTVEGFVTENSRIKLIRTNNGDFDCNEVVIANGSWMPALAKLLGRRLLMQPGKGYSVMYHDLEKNLHHPAILIDHRTATTPIGRWLRIGGTMELSGHNDRKLPKRVQALHDNFHLYFPSMGLAKPDPSTAWFGYRPVTPDGLPFISHEPNFENVVYAGGHAMLGVSAAAATGLLVSQLIGKEKTAVDVEAFGVR